ncbi:DEAD/DEAH box helicase [Erysipelotrichaceae bacterium OttesenSCG-928-M19]|nr:DEAD/DEAH box helicase [Erysipelotrichaceae bacterium OttesenSCG-928-M19]
MYDYQLSFILNPYQEATSQQIVKYFLDNKNIIVDAVCGAGKTEMILEVMKIALNKGYKIGFACPRRQLLIELYQRIKGYFNHPNIGLVMGGIQENSASNLIFLTCHQLVSYYDYFDLLIIDEIDAYPFYNNFELENNAWLSARQFILLSATVPDKYYDLVAQGKMKLVTNYYRHHLKKHPLPLLIKKHKLLLIIEIFKMIKNNKSEPLLIYVPTKKIGRSLSKVLKLSFKKIKFVHGNNINEKIIADFKNRTIDILISTTVLERGITLKKINVLVYDSAHRIFDYATLLQICGRVGRDSVYIEGKLVFLGDTITKAMLLSQQKVGEYNQMLNLS